MQDWVFRLGWLFALDLVFGEGNVIFCVIRDMHTVNEIAVHKTRYSGVCLDL